jgi:uridylate kinase
MLTYVAEEVQSIVDLGVQIAIVVGGGNIFRGLRPVLSVWSGRRPITWGCWPR